jgi:hypothetical protein
VASVVMFVWFAVYYGGQPNGGPGPMAHIPRAPAPMPQTTYTKTKRKGLKIIDPNSMQDISDQIYNSAGASSASSSANDIVVAEASAAIASSHDTHTVRTPAFSGSKYCYGRGKYD